MAAGPVANAPTAPPEMNVNAHLLPRSPNPTYLEVALTPPRPVASKAKTLKPIVAANVCFRCLASDHHVRDCRDPIRCRRCFRSGHRSYNCTMPLAKLLSWGRRQPPTVPIPALHRPMHAVPFDQGLFAAAHPKVPSSPPSSPAHPCALNMAYGARFMVSSSSEEALDFEVPPPLCRLVSSLRTS